MSSPAWLNPAGGLRYHVRALLGAPAWAPFRASLASWLRHFAPSSPRALLIGPSAGYCIPDAFLRQFSELTAFEPDPLAGSLFKRRARRIGLAEPHLERRDQLMQPLLTGAPGMAELLESDPKLCVIFCNLLGQTRFLLAEAELERFKAAFRQRITPLLRGRAWLSFHDRLSGTLEPSFAAPLSVPTRLDDVAVLRDLYRSDRATAPSELLDHESDGFFAADLPHTYFIWRIDRRHCHLIEGVMGA